MPARISRRLLLAGAATLAAGAAIGVSQMRNRHYESMVRDLRAPLPADARLPDLVRYATLAANSHNTQPWRFRPHAGGVTIEPDYAQRTPVVDPDDHHLFVSLGCAAENLSIAARSHGLGGELAVEPVNGSGIGVSLAPSAAARSPLLDAIVRRQSSRSPYDGSRISPEILDRLLAAAAGEPVDIVLVTEGPRLQQMTDLILAGNRAQLKDTAFRAELKSWLRFNAGAATRLGDGLLSLSSGNPSLPDWLGPLMYDVTVKPDGDTDRLAGQLRSSAALVVFVSRIEGPGGWISAGRAYQRFALAATLEDIRHAFVNQAVEVPAMRTELEALLGIRSGRADIILRIGRGPTMPWSLRRPVADVLLA